MFVTKILKRSRTVRFKQSHTPNSPFEACENRWKEECASLELLERQGRIYLLYASINRDNRREESSKYVSKSATGKESFKNTQKKSKRGG